MYRNHYPPFSLLSQIAVLLSNGSSDSDFEDLPSEAELAALITIHSQRDIAEKRRELTAFIWGSAGLPLASRPTSVTEGHFDARFADLPNLQRIDRIQVEMDYKIQSTLYQFHPQRANNRLVIYHQGHRGGFILGHDTIACLLENGYSVMALAMPLLGMNNQPTVRLPRVGPLHLKKHDHLKFLERPIRFFIEPVVIAINHSVQNYDYELISMVGISGGGWTTTITAAVDTRITRSYPVAGSYPLCLRSKGKEWGDFEQTMPELYAVANYLELYIMGAHGPGRTQLQILNRFDPLCFAAGKHELYEERVTSTVRSIGTGRFSVYVDETTREHVISADVARLILDNMDAVTNDSGSNTRS